MGCLYNSAVCIGTAVCIFLLLCFTRSPVADPEQYLFHSLPHLVPNSRLSLSSHLSISPYFGPEAFAVDSQGKVYTGTGNGLILAIDPASREVTVVGRTGFSAPLQCDTAANEIQCGRPLGIHLVDDDTLWIADAVFGMLSMDVKSGIAQPLFFQTMHEQANIERDGVTREGDGSGGGDEREKDLYMLFPNDMAHYFDHDHRDILFVTDSSARYPRREVMYELLDGSATGRLIAIDMATREHRVLVDKIPFANGITLTHERDGVLVISTTRSVVYKYTFGIKTVDGREVSDVYAGSWSILHPSLPCLPDNIKGWTTEHREAFLKYSTESSTEPSTVFSTATVNTPPSYLIGCSAVRAQPFSLFHSVSALPSLRRLIAGLFTYNMLLTVLTPPQSGAIVEMDGSGQVLQTWQDMGDSTPSSERIRFISEVQPIKYSRTQDNGSSDDPQDVYDVHELWYGSWRNGFIGIIPSASTHQATV